MSGWLRLSIVLDRSRLFLGKSFTTRLICSSHDICMADPSTLDDCAMGSEINVDSTNGENTKRPPFGTRYLNDPEKVFEHNAWDNMVWTEEQINAAKQKIEANSENFVDEEKQDMFENEADRFWDDFYSKHQNRFFKDRNWLFKEFPELSTLETPSTLSSFDESSTAGAADQGTVKGSTGRVQREGFSSSDEPKTALEEPVTEVTPTKTDLSLPDRTTDAPFPGSWCNRRYLEVGCGVGNTVFPILQVNNDSDLFVYGCDFSSVAIDLVKSNPEYDPKRCHGFVLDITDTQSTLPFPENSLDVIILIFVLSAVNPEKMQPAVTRLARYLKPGGRILLRDYGKYDLAQLRFKPGRCLSDNFYVRGDGTRVYFFTQEELRTMFTTAGLTEEQNLIDRRLQVNRGRQITMYRVWIQCKYRKPGVSPS